MAKPPELVPPELEGEAFRNAADGLRMRGAMGVGGPRAEGSAKRYRIATRSIKGSGFRPSHPVQALDTCASMLALVGARCELMPGHDGPHRSTADLGIGVGTVVEWTVEGGT
jgi:hypothetical protein